eukprot:m.779979 g.779979  ORF g.779979 m.779979 type:complete len:77 (-) comp23280_c1_seq3:1140-1370(-)
MHAPTPKHTYSLTAQIAQATVQLFTDVEILLHPASMPVENNNNECAAQCRMALCPRALPLKVENPIQGHGNKFLIG